MPYPGRLTLFRAQEQPHPETDQDDLGWSEFALGGVDVRVVPGDHLTMIHEPHVQILAKEIEACLPGNHVEVGMMESEGRKEGQ